MATQYASLREKIAAEKQERLARYAEFQALFTQAYSAGLEAAKAHKPEPMHVVDGFTKAHVATVSEGPCGFAWVNVRPGNSSFARWLVKQGLARSSYYGGVEVYLSEHGQSYERKMKHAQTMAEFLRAANITAFANGRLD